MKTVCLNMIVKNESKIITRFLQNIVDFIDFFVIIDTGSEDNTPIYIQNFFKNYNHIKGIIIKEEFIDFGTNRNRALKYCQGIGDYILLLDADHLLNYNPKDINILKNLELDAYSILQGDENYSCQNIRIIKNNNAFIYKGLTHEVLIALKEVKLKILDKNLISIQDLADGDNRKDKISRDIKLLNIEIESDPGYSRPYFYLANTYFSINVLEKAIEYYKSRIVFGGWNEEMYFSNYRLGLIYIKKKDYKKAIYYFLEAYNCQPKRCENLYYLKKIYNLEGKKFLENLFDLLIKNNLKYDYREFLFYDKNIYNQLK